MQLSSFELRLRCLTGIWMYLCKRFHNTKQSGSSENGFAWWGLVKGSMLEHEIKLYEQKKNLKVYGYEKMVIKFWHVKLKFSISLYLLVIYFTLSRRSRSQMFFKIGFLKVGLSPSKKNCIIYFIESSLKMIKIAFYFIFKALFVLKLFRFLSWPFGHAEKIAWLEIQD